MKVLLDECVPWPIHRFLNGRECQPAQRCGWGGLKNGDLLNRAEGTFDLFITSDQSIRYQQNMAGRSIPIIELSTNDLRRHRRAAVAIASGASNIDPDDYRRLFIP